MLHATREQDGYRCHRWAGSFCLSKGLAFNEAIDAIDKSKVTYVLLLAQGGLLSFHTYARATCIGQATNPLSSPSLMDSKIIGASPERKPITIHASAPLHAP
eukprot:scaffold95726_cov21-Tisochrysis_lutea.AAC.1